MTMPRAVTAGELTTIRKNGGWSELYLAVHIPKTIYSARLAALPASNDEVASITYTSGSGTLANVKIGMTMLVGTSAGADDLGRVRIRATPTGSIFYIGEQSEIIWSASAYLTVIEDFDLWAKHIHMSGETVLMDYDVSYSAQHTTFNPVPVLGPHRVAKLTGATVDVVLGCDTANGQASWVFGSTISAYSWSVPDATLVTGGTTANPTARFNFVGWHACYCTVTATAGSLTKTGVRWVYVYDDDNLPSTVFSIDSWNEDYRDGGISCALTLQAEADISQIPEHAECILFSVDHYGAGSAYEKTSVGQVTYCENIRLVGRIGDEDIFYNSETGRTSVTLYNHRYWFEKLATSPIVLEIATNTPATWNQMTALTVDRGIWHALEWRSTATTIMDFEPCGDALYSPAMETYSGNIWSMMNEYVGQRIMGYIHVDAFGRLFVEYEPQLIAAANRAANVPTVMTLATTDYLAGVDIDKQVISDASMVDVSGQTIDQYGGSPLSYFALSPGHIYGIYGGAEIVDRLLVSGQSDCNQKAGLLYGWRTNKYRMVNIILTGNNNMISCFPNQYIVMSVTARGEALTSINLIPRRRMISFENSTGVLEYSLECEAETFEKNSVAYVPPEGDDISIPPLKPLPPIPDYIPSYPLDPSATGSSAPPYVVATIKNTIGGQPHGIIYSKNFNAAVANDVVWQFWNNGLTTDEILRASQGFADIRYTPSGAFWMYISPTGTTITSTSGGGLFFAAGLGAQWVKKFGYTELVAEYTNPAWQLSIRGFGINPNKPEEVAFIGAGSDFTSFTSDGDFWLGNRSGFTKKVAVTDIDNQYSNMTFGADKWTLFGELFQSSGAWQSYFWRWNADGSVLETSGNAESGGGAQVQFTVRAGTSPRFYYHNLFDRKFYGTTDNGDNFVEVGVLDYSDAGGKMACDPTGQYMVANYDPSAFRGKSSDYGTTWGALSNLPYAGSSGYAYCYAGGIGIASKWIAGYAYVLYSANVFGAESWEVRDGNLPYLITGGRVVTKIIVPGVGQ